MQTHELRCHPGPFESLWDETKTFEWRKDDRGFEVGDRLHILEWDDEKKKYLCRGMWFRVTSISRGPAFGIPEGYVIMSIIPEDSKAITGSRENRVLKGLPDSVANMLGMKK